MKPTLRIKRELLLWSVLCGTFFGLALSQSVPASAANPTTMPFQGKVVNANGTNITDGPYSITFKLYSVASGGTSIWGETQASVQVASGVFQVNLGSTCSLFTTQNCSTFSNTAIDFNASPNLYLGITFNGDAAGEMTPRMQLGSVPYAFNADKVGGLSASQFVQLSVAQQTGSINVSGSITSGSTLAVTGAATFNTTLTVQTTSNSPTAFQVQNTGNNQIFTVDTSASQVVLGKLGAAGINGKLAFNTTNAGNFATTFSASASQGANIDYTLPTAIVTNGMLTTSAGGALSWSTSGANLTSLNPTNLTTGSGAVTLQSFAGTALNLTGSAASTWSIGANALTVTSSNFNVSSAGAITAATTTNTINGLVINSGSLTNVGANITSIAGLTIATTTTGNLTFDTGTTGSILIGGDTANAKTVSIGPTATNTNTTTLNVGVNLAGPQDINIGSTGSNNAAAGTLVSIQGGTTASTAIVLGTNGAGGITIDTGTTGSILIGNGANAKATTIGSTNTTSTTNIQGGVGGGINIGSVGTSTLTSVTHISDTTNGTGTQTVSIGSNANAANGVDIDAGNTGLIQIGDTTTTHTINIASAGAAAGNAQNVIIGSNTTTTAGKVTLQGGNVTTTNNQSGIIIGGGFSSADTTNLVPLVLDSYASLTETASSCTATVNNGAMYFNSNAGSMSMRACTGGAWEDLVSTAGAFFAFFGVAPDSGAVPGDIQALSTANSTGPCKVYWISNASPSQVGVTGCIAYSGGRKVTVAATTLSLTNGNGTFNHICLTGTNSQPAVAGTTTEVASLATASFPSASGPIVCLADIKMANNAISGIYDTRVFTTTTKEFGYAAAALPLGVMVKPDATNINRLALPGTTATGFMRGVVVASNGAAWASGGPNVIIATAGTVPIKATAGTLSTTATVQNSTVTSGYALTSTTVSTNAYGNLGIAQNTFSNTCSTVANCNSSLLVDLRLR